MKIILIADFKDNQIFDAATTYTCVFGFEKNAENKENKLRVIDSNLDTLKYFEISQKELSEPAWIMENVSGTEFVEKIRNKSKYTFDNIAKSISQGIVTGNNSVFIFDEHLIEIRNMNKTFLVPVYKGKDIRNCKLICSNQYLFYPYALDDVNIS